MRLIARFFGNLLFLLGLLIACMCGCSADKNLVANVTAAYMWDEFRYEELCVEVKGLDAEECAAWHDDLAELHKTVKVANEVQKVGDLPKPAKVRLKQLQKAAEE